MSDSIAVTTEVFNLNEISGYHLSSQALYIYIYILNIHQIHANLFKLTANLYFNIPINEAKRIFYFKIQKFV